MLMSKREHNAKRGIYSHVLRYTGLFGGVQGIVVFLSFVRNKFAALFLGSVGIGIIDVYNRTNNLFTAFFSLVTPVAATRSLSVAYETGDKDKLAEQVRVIRSLTLLTAIIGFVVSAVCSPLISYITYGNLSHYMSFLGISPIIPMVILSGTELSILKATRELGSFALSSFYGAVILAAVSIPLYVLLGIGGIIPALLISTFLILVVQLRFTLPLFPWRSNPFSLSTLKKGKDLIKLSVAYIMANVVASAVEFALRSYMIHNGDVNDVGFYSAGLVITVVASRFLFVAMDADFFPTLSGCGDSANKMNLVVNRQMEVCVLLIAPFLLMFNIFMPFIIQLLYTPHFMSILPMVVLASFYMFFKAVSTPVAYIALARGDGKTYLVMETCYYVILLVVVILCYHSYGLTGTGVALSLTNFLETLILASYYRCRYRFVISVRARHAIEIQGILLLLGVIVVFVLSGILRYAVGLPLGLLSVLYTFCVLSKRMDWREVLHLKNPLK